MAEIRRRPKALAALGIGEQVHALPGAPPGARCAIIRIDAVSSGDRNGPFELQIVYGIGGERELTERTLDQLA